LTLIETAVIFKWKTIRECVGLVPRTSCGKKGAYMIRAKIWFRCAAMHDPVTPIVLQPAVIGWEAKKRRVGTQIERAFNGEELVRRMKGWITVDPNEVIEIVKQHGRLKVLDDRELVFEGEKPEDIQKLQKAIQETFGDEVDVEVIPKK
jgi:hypothetical protein